MSAPIRLETGERARCLLSDPGFLSEWQHLAALDAKNTWFQEPFFCGAWYAAYAAVADPLLVLTDGAEGLGGIMPLARLADGQVVHAGAHQCEYQGWVATPAQQQEFALGAVRAVFDTVAPSRWTWKSVAPGAQLDWLEDTEQGSLAGPRRRTRVASPLLDVHNEAFLHERTRKRLKNYWNRLRRRGMRYERLVDRERAAAVLGRLAGWVDLRQGAGKDVLPFGQDPFKLDFHERLLERPDEVWMSVLWLEGQPLAAHLGPRIGNELALGIQGYDPAESRVSPGLILLLEMAADLAQSGGQFLDLTPGGDDFKDRFASDHRDVDGFVLYGSRARRLAVRTATDAKVHLRTALARVGTDPAKVRKALHGITNVTGPRSVALRRIELDLGDLEFDETVEAIAGPESLERLLVRRAASTGAAEGSALLSIAMGRWAAGWRPVATVDDAGDLDMLIWLQPAAGKPRVPAGIPGMNDGEAPPDGTLVIRGDAPGGRAPAGNAAARLRAAVETVGVSADRVWLIIDLQSASRWPQGASGCQAMAS